MARRAAKLAAFLQAHDPVIRVVLARVQGSAPREEGAEIFVAMDALFGSIGGGRLEHLAIEEARRLLRGGGRAADMDIPLGPEIGQCCGGRVALKLTRMNAQERRAAQEEAEAREAARPHVYVMGAGHVGRALARQLQHLPVRSVLIDQRAEEIALCDAAVETRLSALPEAEIAKAPAGSVFLILTHDHGLDFLLTAAALARGDAAYVGMIGSASKRARFRSWMKEEGQGGDVDRLHCPIGVKSGDKRPSVIAAFAIAEIMSALQAETVASARQQGYEAPSRAKNMIGEEKSA